MGLLNRGKDKDQHPSLKRKLTLGQRAADKLTHGAGSWKFILGFFVFLVIWVSLNIYMISQIWDPYPFILLNLFLSCLAAVQAPIILMSQNRQVEVDRISAKYDYLVDRKAERGIQNIQKELEEIKDMLRKRYK
jgi:uncharacterized membrane protein